MLPPGVGENVFAGRDVVSFLDTRNVLFRALFDNFDLASAASEYQYDGAACGVSDE
jgi:hypothetical protein